jgi:hypothetical protein
MLTWFVYIVDMKRELLTVVCRNGITRFGADANAVAVKLFLLLTGKPLFSAKTISKATSEVLKRFDRRAHLRYVAEHPSLQG